MKIYLVLISLFICSIINAQTPDWWPTHPMETRIGDKPDIQPDTIITKSGYTDDDNKIMITYIHSYGDNGYIDSTKIYCTDTSVSLYHRAFIFTYAKENNKLISEEKYLSENFNGLSERVFYEYDLEGRRTKEHYIVYNDQGIITRDETTIHDFSTINKTDSGYIYNRVTYFFDDKDRLVKEISGEDITSAYISTYIYHDCGYDVIRDTDSWCFIDYYKTSYSFEENGLLSKLINYTQPGIRPEGNTTEYFYSFSPGNATSNSFVTNIPEIYGTTGGLITNTNQPEWIMIYTLSGQLVKKEYVNQNQQIPLPKGIYIIKSTNKTFKVAVK